ncbi:MAG: CRISPR-associated helicase Cas3' [Desulfurivibrio sp.]|nr:CRISPR-associated helicase Cas3' [Desulfurivibrio sp.]
MVFRAPWGKTKDDKIHHLAHHCADVAACFEALVALPVVRARLNYVAGSPLSSACWMRLSVLAFLHDVGKLHPGFQAKGWPPTVRHGALHGHVKEGAAIFAGGFLDEMARKLCVEDLMNWGTDGHLLFSVLAHHGRPFLPDHTAGDGWEAVSALSYDPSAAAGEMGAMMRRWFPAAFNGEKDQLPSNPEFQHFLCGLVSLADWLGSDARMFPFVGDLDHDYMALAHDQARAAVAKVGLDVEGLRPLLKEKVGFDYLTGFAHPRPQQRLVGEAPLEERLIILEAETGSGKTEAALWRFIRLFEAGQVDSLYFALPTRAAALQLHGRVNQTLVRLFGDRAPEAVLAVPGYLKIGEVEGRALPGWRVQWDDEADEPRLLARWAAENARRYLAATVSVGTVDQAMLAALQVKHAHLRAAALSRSLLVVDEVHASDSYMAKVQEHLLRQHLRRGGHAMLMSATLGSVARTVWLGHTTPSFEEAVAAPYPALWLQGKERPTGVSQEKQKKVNVEAIATMAPEKAAELALRAAENGARVLLIRNTVTMAVATWRKIFGLGGESLLLSVDGGAALHHGRFAPEDRKLLDEAVEGALAPKADRERGIIVVGSQTLEQSLDIDADLLITDLCPVDVLLQRIGRLHRHSLNRPSGFEQPRCYVMVPENGLEPLLKPAFVNGLGGWLDNGVLCGIYRDLSGLELARRLIVEHPLWVIPEMNRLLVESATHQERIDALHNELGAEWVDYWNNVYGKDLADMSAARHVVVPMDTPFAEAGNRFVSDEEKVRTRLGAEGAMVQFVQPVPGPYGAMISGITLPTHYSRGIDTSEAVSPRIENGLLRFEIGKQKFCYDRSGLSRESFDNLDNNG